MGHNNNIYDFCGEISEILPNTLSKVAPKTTFVEKTVMFSQKYNILLVKNFRWGIVGKQACPL